MGGVLFMKKRLLSWKEKYLLSLNETLTLKQIMLLRSCGMPKARKLRQEVIEYCLIHNIKIESKGIPSEVLFEITGLNVQYYFDKMQKEILATTQS